MLQSHLCGYSDAESVAKGTVTAVHPDDDAYDKKLSLKIMHHLLVLFQKLVIHLLTMQKPKKKLLKLLCH